MLCVHNAFEQFALLGDQNCRSVFGSSIIFSWGMAVDEHVMDCKISCMHHRCGDCADLQLRTESFCLSMPEWLSVHG